jgi:hypothetical protein
MEKTKCSRCLEFREYLNKDGLCIFCEREMKNKEVEGYEVRSITNTNIRGKEIKSNNIKDHSWMGR